MVNYEKYRKRIRGTNITGVSTIVSKYFDFAKLSYFLNMLVSNKQNNDFACTFNKIS